MNLIIISNFWKFDINIYWQSKYWDIKFNAICFKRCSSCLCCIHWIISTIFTQFFDHVKSSSILQLIKDKLRDLQTLIKYFNGATISTLNLLVLPGVLPIIFVLYSKDLLIVAFLLFVLYLLLLSLASSFIIIPILCYNFTKLLMSWNNCHCTLTNCALV